MGRDDVLLGGDSPEEVLVSVVRKYGNEIYLDSYRFRNMLLDLMGHEKKLLKIISIVLEHGGGERILKMASFSRQQLGIERRKLILFLAEESLTDELHIHIGVDLLLNGIGIQVGELEGEWTEEYVSKPKPLGKPRSVRPSKPVGDSVGRVDVSDFTIENGVLEKYKGKDLEVVIPDGVTEIGSCAFYNCSGLERVVIPNGVIEIGSSAFYNCSGLKSVIIPDGVTKIGSYVFYNCSALERVSIPYGVSMIREYTFYGCSALNDVYFKNTNVKIGHSAFLGCPWQP